MLVKMLPDMSILANMLTCSVGWNVDQNKSTY